VIGVDQFASVFGGAPEHTRSRPAEHVRAIIRAGWSPVLCLPGTDQAGCILPPTTAKRPHECGAAHILDTPSKVSSIVTRFLAQHGGANIALHLGRSNLAVLESPAVPGRGYTVATPDGKGQWWYTLPPGRSLSPEVVPPWSGWTLITGDRYVLVPPATTPDGTYRLVGGTTPWLGAL